MFFRFLVGLLAIHLWYALYISLSHSQERSCVLILISNRQPCPQPSTGSPLATIADNQVTPRRTLTHTIRNVHTLHFG
jgi:hypothetical protein